MSDVQFYFENERDFIVFNGELSTYPDITFGETNTFEFYIKSGVDNTERSTGATYSGVTGGTYSGVTGATYSTANTKDTYDTPEQIYQQVKEYEQYAGYATSEQTLEGTYFSENPDFSRANIDGIVTSIRPGDDVDQARGVWGIIESITDDTQIFGAIARISIDVFVLSRIDEYNDEAAVRTAFEADF